MEKANVIFFADSDHSDVILRNKRFECITHLLKEEDIFLIEGKESSYSCLAKFFQKNFQTEIRGWEEKDLYDSCI